MYNEHFGFNEAPFSISPDPRFLYMSDRHRDALAHLIYGAGENGGFVLLTGQVGTGKTTLIRSLLSQKLDNTDIAMCLHSGLSVIDFVASILDELHIEYEPNPTSLKPLVDALNRYLLAAHANGRQTVLIVDEAQNLSREILEQVRLLTNLETNSQKLLRIILVGQEELQAIINREDLRQLSQRITMRYHLTALNPSEVNEYVAHRVKIAGGNPSVFAASATRQIYKLTSGVPRLINVLCDRALLTAYNEGVYRVSGKHIQNAAEETLPKQFDSGLKSNKNSGLKIRPILLLMLLGGLGYGGYRYYVEGDAFIESMMSSAMVTELQSFFNGSSANNIDTALVNNRDPDSRDAFDQSNIEPTNESDLGGQHTFDNDLVSDVNTQIATSNKVDDAKAITLNETDRATHETLFASNAPAIYPITHTSEEVSRETNNFVDNYDLVDTAFKTTESEENQTKQKVKEVSDNDTEAPVVNEEITLTSTAANNHLETNALNDKVGLEVSEQGDATISTPATTIDNDKSTNDSLASTSDERPPDWRNQEVSQTAGIVTLLSAWQLPTAIPANQTACQYAQTHLLQCVTGQGGFPVLRVINRPALLELQLPDYRQWLPIVALDESNVTAEVDGKAIKISFTEITPYFTGNFLVLLEKPNVSLQIVPGFEGEQIKWLRQRIAIAEGKDFRNISESLEYDDALVQRVKQFQSQRQLMVDGIVGAESLLHLYNVVVDENTPLLNPSR